MPFSLFNASTTFQNYINKILTKKLDIFVIVYLNNILIYIKNLGQTNVNTIQWVLEFLRKNSLFINHKKCCFPLNKVRFLEFVIFA